MFLVLFRNFCVCYIVRLQSCDLHSHVLCHLFYSVIYHIGSYVYQNTDLAAHMSVRSNKTVFLGNLYKSSDVHVLADDCDLSRQSFLYGLGSIEFPRLCQESIDICCSSIHRLLCYLCYVILEFLVLCHEVCLRIYFYGYSFLVIIGYDQFYQTLCRNSASFLLSSSQSLFSQPFNGFFHITFGSGQGFLTVHHTGTGSFSQLFYHSCCDSHLIFLLVILYGAVIHRKGSSSNYITQRPQLPLPELPLCTLHKTLQRLPLPLHPDLPQ